MRAPEIVGTTEAGFEEGEEGLVQGGTHMHKAPPLDGLGISNCWFAYEYDQHHWEEGGTDENEIYDAHQPQQSWSWA